MGRRPALPRTPRPSTHNPGEAEQAARRKLSRTCGFALSWDREKGAEHDVGVVGVVRASPTIKRNSKKRIQHTQHLLRGRHRAKDGFARSRPNVTRALRGQLRRVQRRKPRSGGWRVRPGRGRPGLGSVPLPQRRRRTLGAGPRGPHGPSPGRELRTAPRGRDPGAPAAPAPALRTATPPAPAGPAPAAALHKRSSNVRPHGAHTGPARTHQPRHAAQGAPATRARRTKPAALPYRSGAGRAPRMATRGPRGG